MQYRRGNTAVDAAIAALAAETGHSPIMARLLYTRGYRTPEEVEAFFHQESACLHDPFLLQDIVPAVERIEAALEKGVKVTGATVHYVNEIPDGGEIILQKSVTVKRNETPESLQQKVMRQAEWKILPKAAELVSAEIIASRKVK